MNTIPILNNIRYYLNKEFSKNIYVKQPVLGCLFLIILSVLFTYVYHPHQVTESYYYGYHTTIFIYASLIYVFSLLICFIFKLFFKNKIWKFKYELGFLLCLLFFIGLASYVGGFFIEDTTYTRLRFYTFIDSVSNAMTICFIPTVLPTILAITLAYNKKKIKVNQEVSIVNIKSKTGKDHIKFVLEDFVYAESQGNYVEFVFFNSNEIKKKLIRTSISYVEKQLLEYNVILKTHRAFLVNINWVVSKTGNALGYKIQLKNMDKELIVSRSKIKEFDDLLEKQGLYLV